MPYGWILSDVTGVFIRENQDTTIHTEERPHEDTARGNNLQTKEKELRSRSYRLPALRTMRTQSAVEVSSLRDLLLRSWPSSHFVLPSWLAEPHGQMKDQHEAFPSSLQLFHLTLEVQAL